VILLILIMVEVSHYNMHKSTRDIQEPLCRIWC